MSIENTWTGAHAMLGASNAHRWTVCKRSPLFIRELQLVGTIPVATYNKYAAEGTVAHKVAEDWINGKPINIGSRVKQDGYDITISDEMIDAVAIYYSYINSQRQPGAIVKSEQQLEIPEPWKRDNYELTGPLWGTTDALIIKPYQGLEIVDYKHGAGKSVEVVDNVQLKYYAAAAYFNLPEDLRREIPVVKTTIVQPRHFSAQGTEHGGVWSASYTPDVISEFREWIVNEASQVKPDSELVAGNHCEWCPAALHCPERLAHHSNKLGMMLEKADSIERVPPPLPISALSDDQILTIVENADIIRDYVESAEEWLKAGLLAGKKFGDYGLKVNYGHPKWKQEVNVEEVFEALGDARYEPKKTKTPAKMRDAAKKAKLDIDVESLTDREISSYKLVRGQADDGVTIKKMLETADSMKS